MSLEEATSAGNSDKKIIKYKIDGIRRHRRRNIERVEFIEILSSMLKFNYTFLKISKNDKFLLKSKYDE